MTFHQLAPGLYSTLKKNCSCKDFDYIERLFNFSTKNGSLNESPIIREKEVSFNPRPARYACIIIKETGILDPLVIGASFFLGIQVPHLDIYDEDLQGSLKLADKTNNILNNYLIINNNLTIPEVILTYTHTLDKARHLHMSNLHEKEKEAFCDFIGHLLKKLPKYKESDRLTLMLEAWLSSSRLKGPFY